MTREALEVLEPSRGILDLRLREVWRHRDLLWYLIWRDVKVRYKQTVLGALWAILQPLLAMVVFTIFFGGLAKVPSDGLPYPIFSFAALVPWTFFAQGVTQSANSLAASAHLVRKVWFPRFILPASAVLSGVVDFLLAFVVLLGLMAWYGLSPQPAALLLPAVFLLAVLAALGLGTWLSALNAVFRDIRYVVPFFVQLLLFLTPVIWSAGDLFVAMEERGIPGWLMGLNPMAGVTTGFRYCLLGCGPEPWTLLLVGYATALVVLGSGLIVFRRIERVLADVL